ncbi:MAG: response regulator transcription factor [Ornithinibacter sp.]
MRILIVEDDDRLRALLADTLAEAGWDVEEAADGRAGVGAALGGTHDVVLLDVLLPGLDGISLCRRLRAAGNEVPVLMLTARDQVASKIEGLDAGADDYLPKPFDVDELLARLRALTRRTAAAQGPIIIGDLRVDPAARRVARAGTEIELTAREFDILELLVSRAGQVVTRFEILDEVWDGETDLRSNVIDVYLASIRAKIDRPFGTRTITTVRGAGYRVEPSPAPGTAP